MKKFLIFTLTNLLVSMQTCFAIEDFMLQNLDSSLKVKKINYEPIKDELVDKTLDKNLKVTPVKPKPITDEYLPKISSPMVAVIKKHNFDFENTDEINLKIIPAKYYTTRQKLKVGEYIDFYLADDVTINNKTYNKGELIKARIENVSQNGIGGVPADLTIGNFIIKDEIIKHTIDLHGANRSLWLYPTFCVSNVFFGAGILLYPIRGGHAKLKPNKIYKIVY